MLPARRAAVHPALDALEAIDPVYLRSQE